MNDDSYSFSEFLKSIEDLDFLQAALRTEQELSSVHIVRYKGKDARMRGEHPSLKYEDKLKGLLFWFHSCVKPATLSDSDFQLIRPLCEKLVAKNQLKSSALTPFDE